jgi:hypothetical protein
MKNHRDRASPGMHRNLIGIKHLSLCLTPFNWIGLYRNQRIEFSGCIFFSLSLCVCVYLRATGLLWFIVVQKTVAFLRLWADKTGLMVLGVWSQHCKTLNRQHYQLHRCIICNYGCIGFRVFLFRSVCLFNTWLSRELFTKSGWQ